MELNKKTHQKFIKKIEYNKNKIQIMYGYYGIKAICSGLLSLSQIEASRRIISKVTKKFAKMWLRLKPNICISKKPEESRMGKGVGKIKKLFYEVNVGTVILELGYISSKIAYPILLIASKKLKVKTIICRKFF